MNKLLSIILTVFILVVYVSGQKYEVPPPLIEPLSPRGFRVSIPDYDGITLFAFHGNVNQDFENGREAGQVAVDVLRKKNGRWVYHNREIKLKKGDILYYWLYVIKDGLGYERLFQSYEVKDLQDGGSEPNPIVPPPRPVSPPQPESPSTSSDNYPDSLTTVNGIAQSSGKLLKHYHSSEDFTQDWSHVIQFMDDEGDFTLFKDDHETTYATLQERNDGVGLAIRPILLDKKYGEGFTSSYNATINLGHKCTSSDQSKCVQSVQGKTFLPPILSSRLTTEKSFSFRYGTIEIKAALPHGDWVVPEIWLLPKLSRYGMSKMILACAFGNDDLQINDKDRGNKYLYSGFQVGIEPVSYGKTISSGSLNNYHTYKMVWGPDRIVFYYDNEEIGHWSAKVHPPFINENEGKIAPFNQEFYIALGVHVGGVGDFSGHVVNRGRGKPWKDLGVSRRKDFYDDYGNWSKTWSESETALKISHIKVWAL